jgi:hypothetical protein
VSLFDNSNSEFFENYACPKRNYYVSIIGRMKWGVILQVDFIPFFL